MALKEDTVLLLNKGVLESTLSMMKQLIDDMEANDGDVPYMFVYNGFQSVANQLEHVHYEGIVESHSELGMTADGQHVMVLNSDFKGFHRRFNVIASWAQVLKQGMSDLPHDRIPVWTGYVKESIEYIEPYMEKTSS